MLGGLITIAGGIIASSGFIVKRRPDAQQLIDKLMPYQGWIGVVMFGWGIKETLFTVLHLGLLLSYPLHAISAITNSAADLLVGFLLGFGLIVKYAFKADAQPAAQAQPAGYGYGMQPMAQGPTGNANLDRAHQIRSKLVAVQAPLGLLAIIAGVLYIVL